MIDLKDLIRNPELYRESQRARGLDVAVVDCIMSADAERRAAITSHEELRSQQNALNKELRGKNGEEQQKLLLRLKELSQRVKTGAHLAEEARKRLDGLVLNFPNLVDSHVPRGGEENSVVMKHVGTPRQFDFEPRDHLVLGEGIGGIDMERGAKVSGARFSFLRGPVARLELALMMMALDQAVDHGFVPMIPPTLVRPNIMSGTGFDIAHNEEIYHLVKDDLYLVGTSEVALAGYHSDEIVDLSAGPLRYVGWSSCYRREAGSAGQDTRGIIRVHQFTKVEMFSYTHLEDAESEHERLLAWEEEMLAKVEVPYRVIDTAAGDLGDSAARKFDCEAWIPTQGRYRELTSTSNCSGFQARRLGIRERIPEKKTTQAVATLNGTLATTRWIVAILENHQNSDGTIAVPAALRPYLRGAETIERNDTA